MKFHKVRDVSALPGMRLSVQFANGTTKIHDVAPPIRLLPAFAALEDEVLLGRVEVNRGGYGIVWNDELDLACDELRGIGVEAATPFDGLMSSSDVSELWGLSESTPRKAITYGKIDPCAGARKYGKQRVVNLDAMSARVRRPGRRMVHGLSCCQALGSIGRICPFDTWRETPVKTLSAKPYKFKFLRGIR